MKDEEKIFEGKCGCRCGTIIRIYKTCESFPPDQRYRVLLKIPRDIKPYLTKHFRFFDIYTEELPKRGK